MGICKQTPVQKVNESLSGMLNNYGWILINDDADTMTYKFTEDSDLFLMFNRSSYGIYKAGRSMALGLVEDLPAQLSEISLLNQI